MEDQNIAQKRFMRIKVMIQEPYALFSEVKGSSQSSLKGPGKEEGSLRAEKSLLQQVVGKSSVVLLGSKENIAD
jgi:hypothetical protein